MKVSSKSSNISVTTAKRISGEITVPGDKSISHRAVILASIAHGRTRLEGFLPGQDCLCTMRAMQALGAHIEEVEPTTLEVEGTAGQFKPACEPLDCGNSGTTMRLLAGLLAAQPFESRLFGDSSLSSRPMNRILDPLRKMGARLEALGNDDRPPLRIQGGKLKGIAYKSPVASAQVKSCVLLGGLFAEGTTSVTEPTASRDHTERLLEHFHAPPLVEGKTVSVRGGTRLHGHDLQIPGDFSSAAFWLVAAAVAPGAELSIRQVGLNPTRTGLISILLRMGAYIRETITTPGAEHCGALRVQGRRLRGTVVSGGEIPNVIDELPILSVAAALASGETLIKDASELRVKETDRIRAMATNLAAFGVPVEERPDGLLIQGGRPLEGATVQSFGDHRIAMACAVAGLFAKGTTVVEDVDCIATSYPSFAEDLERVTGQRLGKPKGILGVA